MHAVTKVSVVPPTPAFVNNALFERRRQDIGSQSPNAHWMDCFAELYKKAAGLNILLATDDVLPVEDADIVIYMRSQDLPNTVVEQKRDHPDLKAILVCMETALGARYTFNPRNHRGFDAVMTYDERLVDDQRYFLMRPRAYYRERITTGAEYQKRRVGCLVGTNRPMRYRTGLIAMKKGWRFSWHDWMDYVLCPGQLITYRSEVGRLCAGYPSGTFDLYGEGWDLHPETREACLGVPKTSTLSYVGNYRYYMAFENHTSQQSLVSERIWDALWGDSVPVYYGNKRIDRYVPRECFVDASAFDSPKDMLDWLAGSSEAEWTRYRNAGREFIRSARIEPFLPDACAEEFLRQIVNLAKSTAIRTPRSARTSVVSELS